jgi:hypothetical protein
MSRRRKDKSRPSPKSSPAEPRRLRPPAHDFARPTQDLFRPWAIGVVLAVLGIAIAAGSAKRGAAWEKGASDCSQATGCQKQRCQRDAELGAMTTLVEQSAQRQQDLQSALSDRSSPAFVSARPAIAKEAKFRHRLELRKDALLAEGTHKGVELGVVLFWSLLSFVVGQLLVRAARSVNSLRWARQSYAWAGGAAALVFVGHIVAELLTSVFADHKSLFGWHSFCVSPVAWAYAQAATLGVCFTLVYPLAIAYALGDASARREPQLDHPDAGCGVGGYVKIAKWAAIVGLSAVIVAAVLGLDVLLLVRRAFNPAGLLVPILLLALVLFLLGRMVMNVLWIRERYRVQNWQLELAGDPKPRAPDPTRRFFVPVIVVPALILILVLCKWVFVRHFGIMGPALDQMLVGLLG